MQGFSFPVAAVEIGDELCVVACAGCGVPAVVASPFFFKFVYCCSYEFHGVFNFVSIFEAGCVLMV